MKILTRIRNLFRRDKLETEMAEEMRHHVELQTELNIKAGMNPDEAWYAALRQFGNLTIVQERVREQRGWIWLEQGMKDTGFVVRSLCRARGFTLTVILTLAVGISAAMTAISLTDWILFQRSPFPKPEDLVSVGIKDGANAGAMNCTGVEFSGFQEQTKVFASLVGEEQLFGYVLIDGESNLMDIMSLTGDPEQTFGAKFSMGRGFLPEEYRVGAGNVVVISDRFWRTKLHAASAVLGQSLVIDQQPYAIIGVLAPEQTLFAGWSSEVYRPLAFEADPNKPFAVSLSVEARLKPGVTRQQAAARLSTLKPVGLPPWAVSYFSSRKPVLEDVFSASPKPYWLLLAAGLLLYASACLNALNLMMARLLGRQRELGIRLAIGGSRWQVARLLSLESMILALASGVLVAFTWRWVLPSLATLLQGSYGTTTFSEQWWQVGWETLGVAIGWSAFAGVAVALVPLVRVLKGDLNTAIREGGQGHGESRRMARLRQTLVVVQASFAVLLLVGAGLMVRSFERMEKVDLGFERTGKISIKVMFPRGYDPAPEARLQLFERLAQRLVILPGVKGVTYGLNGLLEGEWQSEQIKLPDGTIKSASSLLVGADFAKIAGLTMIKGRWFAERSGGKSEQLEVVINQTMARQFFGDRDPLGQAIPGSSNIVVGVVRDVKGSLRQPVGSHYYIATWLNPEMIRNLLLRMESDPPKEFSALIQRAVYGVDSRLIVMPATSIADRLKNSMWSENFAYRTLRVLAPVALGLAVIGLFSVLACNVETRTREFGVRLALGATPRDLIRLVMSRGVGAAAMGVIVGALAAAGLTRFMQSLLFETAPTDPLVYLGVAAMLLAAAALACWLPARRAAKVDPVIALRAE